MKAIFILAHPDDECFSGGGTIAKLTSLGTNVKLVSATRGEAGSVGNPPVCDQKDLGKVREKELKKAAKMLGISQIYFLNFIDGTLKKIPLKKISDKIFKILQDEQPDVVITFNKEGGSRHPDHIHMSKAATSAFKKYLKNSQKHVRLYHSEVPQKLLKLFEEKGLGYSAFGKIKGTADSQITTVINIKDTLQIKIKALKCHQTQKKDWQRYLKRLQVADLNYEYFQLILENDMSI